MREPTVKNFLKATVLATIAASAVAAYADQPVCTGDRHYDEAGQCCPMTTTTTTLPGSECQVCEPVLPCADPAPCPTVTCQDGADGDDGHASPPTIVQVDRCPAPEVLEVCKVRGNGIVVCSRAKRKGAGRTGSRKILVPRSIIDQIADRERNYDN